MLAKFTLKILSMCIMYKFKNPLEEKTNRFLGSHYIKIVNYFKVVSIKVFLKHISLNESNNPKINPYVILLILFRGIIISIIITNA